MPLYRTLDDTGHPTRVRWTWLVPSRPDAPARRPWTVLPLYLLPPLVILLVLAAWVLLAWSQGPSVVAVTLFSPISSTLIFAGIALCLWQVRCLSRHAAASRAAMVARRECPGCTYPLAQSNYSRPPKRPHANDGTSLPDDPLLPNLARCPECGSVWNLSPTRDTTQLVRVSPQPPPTGEPLAK